jgi:hypothetical protein
VPSFAASSSNQLKGATHRLKHPDRSVVNSDDINAMGRWVGLSYDGNIVTGWSSMARSEAEARELVGELKEQDADRSG